MPTTMPTGLPTVPTGIPTPCFQPPIPPVGWKRPHARIPPAFRRAALALRLVERLRGRLPVDDVGTGPEQHQHVTSHDQQHSLTAGAGKGTEQLPKRLRAPISRNPTRSMPSAQWAYCHRGRSVRSCLARQANYQPAQRPAPTPRPHAQPLPQERLQLQALATGGHVIDCRGNGRSEAIEGYRDARGREHARAPDKAQDRNRNRAEGGVPRKSPICSQIYFFQIFRAAVSQTSVQRRATS